MTEGASTNLFREIESALDSSEPEVRRLAVQKLRELSGQAAPPLLLRALADDDWRVRKEASEGAAQLVPRGPVVELLVGALAEAGAIGLRNSAVEALVGIGSEAVPPVIESFVWLDADGRKLATEVLAGIPDERGVDQLVLLLKDEDTNVRATAAESLAVAALAGETARTRATQALVAAAHEGELFVRLAALEGLTRLEAELDWPSLQPLLADAVTRRHALAFAARSDVPEALEALARAIGDTSPTLASEAAEALTRRLEEEDGVVSPALRCAADVLTIGGPEHLRLRAVASGERVSVRAKSAALALLGLVGDPQDVPLLSLALGDEGLLERAELGLRLYGEQAIEPMIVAAREAPSDVRAAALSMVPALSPANTGSSGGTPVAGTADLRGALRDSNPDLRALALKMLAQIGTPDDIPTVAALVSDPSAQVAAAAASALLDLAPLHREAARRLIELGTQAMASAEESQPADQRSAAGCWAAAALIRAGEHADDTVRAMALTSLVHGSSAARRAALETFAALGHDTPEEARAAVAFALADEEREVVIGAVRALAAMGHAEPLVSFLASTDDSFLAAATLSALADADPERGYREALTRLSSADPAVATAAVAAVARAGEEYRAEALSLAALHPDDGVVKAALTELAQSGGADAWVYVERALDHDNWKVRRFAAELLATRAPGSDDAKLRQRLEHERDPLVKEAITRALTYRAVGGAGGGRDREGA
jgi:HEAT repeat protein